jgi:hypothetical protein
MSQTLYAHMNKRNTKKDYIVQEKTEKFSMKKNKINMCYVTIISNMV